MPSYESFMCPNCEGHFRVIWPEPLPSHYHFCSKIKLKCPDCQEVTEIYDFLIDRITCAPDPSIPTVEVLSISPRDPNPEIQPKISVKRTCKCVRSLLHIKRFEERRGSQAQARYATQDGSAFRPRGFRALQED